METEYRRTWNQSYMILKEELPGEGYELNMLKYNEISGLLPMQSFTEEGKTYPKYEITGRKSMDSYLENQEVNSEIFRKILENLIHLCRELEKYLLDEDCLLLNQEMIFLDEERKEMYFCYHPGKKRNMKESFRELLEELMMKLDHGKREETEMVYALYQRVQEENCSLLELQELFFLAGEEKGQDYDRGEKQEDVAEYEADYAPVSRAGEKQPGKFGNYLENLKDKLSSITTTGAPLMHMDGLKLERLKRRERKGTGRQMSPRQKAEEFRQDTEDFRESRSPERSFKGEAARLIYLGKGEERDFILDQPVFIIGRDEKAVNGVLKSMAAGGVQAKVMRKEDGYYIEDMNSSNGTLVNGELLIYKNARKLVEGDRITFADISYRFLTFCHNSII